MNEPNFLISSLCRLMFDKFLASGARYLSITSFNEWHEGTQIEPAVPKKTRFRTYKDYLPHQPDFYLHLTNHMVARLSKKTWRHCRMLDGLWARFENLWALLKLLRQNFIAWPHEACLGRRYRKWPSSAKRRKVPEEIRNKFHVVSCTNQGSFLLNYFFPFFCLSCIPEFCFW